MRITKKYKGNSSLGKHVFLPADNMNQAVLERIQAELSDLETKFVEKLKKTSERPSSLAVKQLPSLITPPFLPTASFLSAPALPFQSTNPFAVPVPLYFPSASAALSVPSGSNEASSSAEKGDAMRLPFDTSVYYGQYQMQSIAQARAYMLAQAHAYESYAVEQAQLHDYSSTYAKSGQSIYNADEGSGSDKCHPGIKKTSGKVATTCNRQMSPASTGTDSSASGPDLLLHFLNTAQQGGQRSESADTTYLEGLPYLDSQGISSIRSWDSTSSESSDQEKCLRKISCSLGKEDSTGSDISETSSENDSKSLSLRSKDEVLFSKRKGSECCNSNASEVNDHDENMEHRQKKSV